MTSVKRRLQRIASTFNAKARRLHVPGVIGWQMLAAMPGDMLLLRSRAQP